MKHEPPQVKKMILNCQIPLLNVHKDISFNKFMHKSQQNSKQIKKTKERKETTIIHALHFIIQHYYILVVIHIKTELWMILSICQSPVIANCLVLHFKTATYISLQVVCVPISKKLQRQKNCKRQREREREREREKPISTQSWSPSYKQTHTKNIHITLNKHTHTSPTYIDAQASTHIHNNHIGTHNHNYIHNHTKIDAHTHIDIHTHKCPQNNTIHHSHILSQHSPKNKYLTQQHIKHTHTSQH